MAMSESALVNDSFADEESGIWIAFPSSPISLSHVEIKWKRE